MMTTPESQYLESVSRLNEVLFEALEAFATWVAQEWKMPNTEAEWAKTFTEPWPGQAWIDAYHADIESVPDALKAFLGDLDM